MYMDNQTPIYTQEPEKPKRSIGKKILIAVAIFVIALVGIFAIVMMSTAQPVKISDQYLSHLQAGKSSEMYSMMYPHESVTQEEVSMMVDRIGPLLTGEPKITSREIHSDSTTGTSATITYTIDSVNEQLYVVTIKLIKDSEDEWKILTFNSSKAR